MADIDFDRTGFGAFLQSGTELVALCGRIQTVEDFAQRAANYVLWKLGAVFGPVGFQNSGFRDFHIDQEPKFLPELLDVRPEFIGRTRYHQPALRTRTLDAHLVYLWQQILCRRGARLPRALAGVGRERGGTLARGNIRNHIALIAALLGQVGWNFKRRQLPGRLVFDLLGFREYVAATAGKHPDQ